MKLKYLIILGFIGICIEISAQNNEKQELKDLFEVSEHTSYNGYIKNSSNELEFTAAVLFVGYKTFFSSQDMQSCVFYPSCSVYAVECLRQEPFPKSVFKIYDRLTRCHPFASPKYYKIHESGQFYDPVKE
ncbi:membrane protein insertion efficiency factor YidD [Saccharicrinis sp. FJH62]|uniref:membrane protein insertion efficiency factor YidD n=1 Tax=Saccharicrinis sp. FJH62 TaxID=3344657 RepID=UPI0035D4DFFA